MPKCLLKYQWVKLSRGNLPAGKGIMGYWAKLASRAAFRKGQAKYCGYTNDVVPGMWSGGMVGLKSILGVKSRTEAVEIMNTLQQLGYIRYMLDKKTKKLEYGKPVYDGENIRTISVESVRYKSTPSRFKEPEKRPDNGIKAPKRRK